MRILFISSFYPPHEIGGWEQLAQELASHLRNRGHELKVLTSVFGTRSTEAKGQDVVRSLRLENNQFRYRPAHFFLNRGPNHRRNRQVLGDLVKTFRPQAAVIHTMWNLSRQIPWQVEQLLPGRVVYYLADYWPCEPDVNERFWREQLTREGGLGWRGYLARTALGRLEREKKRYRLPFGHPVFVSHAVQQRFISEGLNWARKGPVIYNGSDVHGFSPRSLERNGSAKLLLFVGSLSPEKGLTTLLDALAVLKNDPDGISIKLKVAGTGHGDHVRQITAQITKLGLDDQVSLLGRLPREQMPELYRQAYALAFPSIWQEPLARTTQEAMASGLPVIATLTGGTAELVAGEMNGLAFEPENERELAAQIKRLWSDPELARRLGQAARQTVMERFSIEGMTDRFEQYLLALIAKAV